MGGLQSCVALGKTLENKKNKQQNVQTETGKSRSFLVALCKRSENQLKPAFWSHRLGVPPLYTSLFTVSEPEEPGQLSIDRSGESGRSSVQMAVG